MKFISDTVELKAALQKAKTTISQKDIQPVLRNFCLKLIKNELSVMATDMDLATVCKIDVKGKKDGFITVPGEKLFQIVDLASSDEISFSLEEMKATIVAGGYTANLNCLSADDFPTIVEFDNANPLRADTSTFLENLNRISFSISDNEARKNLLAVYINDGYIQASDGHVSSVCKFDSTINKTLIPSLAVPDLVRVLKNSSALEIEIASSDSFLMFRLDKDLFVTRLSQAKFPDIPKLVLKPTEKNDIVVEIVKKDLVDAVRRISITSNENSHAVFFSCNGDKMELSSTDIDGNNSIESLDVSSNKNINFILSHVYVLDICKSIVSDAISLKVNENLRIPIRIEDGDFICMLMRLSPVSKKDDGA